MDVLVASDASYAPHLRIMLHSLLTNSRQARTVRVHAILEASKAMIGDLADVCGLHGAGFAAIEPPARAYEFSNNKVHGQRSASPYFRVSAAEVLPRLDRVLYLDADLIVRKPLDPLWHLVLDGSPIAASAWHSPIKDPVFMKPFSGRYFNTGVALFDLAEWRRRDVAGQCSAIARQHPERIKYWDQCLLNYVCADWKPISPTWNYSRQLAHRWAPRIGLAPQDLDEISMDPAIVHFMGPKKPWHDQPGTVTGWAAEYWRYHADLARVLPAQRNPETMYPIQC